MTSCCRLVVVGAALLMMSRPATAQMRFEWETVGNPGNEPDPEHFLHPGAVSYIYRISAHEVTNAQYAAFLNAAALSDPHGLYDYWMGTPYGGILRWGVPGALYYEVVDGRADKPVIGVSFLDAMRFVNWLENGQGNGSTESGTYEIDDGLTEVRKAGAKYFVPSYDEWYKAAYHQPTTQGGDSSGYWPYPQYGYGPPVPGVNANFNMVVGNTVDVGQYAPTFYGLYDMAGNAQEWHESLITPTTRGLIGGSWGHIEHFLRATTVTSSEPQFTDASRGFRVASVYVCPADYNESGDEGDILDFLDFMDDFGTCLNEPGPCGEFGDADVNADTIVDILDFLDFLDAFGQGC